MTDTTNIAVLDIDPKMVLEIAYGIRDPAEIAEDFGFTPDEWEKLKTYEPFVKVVDTRKAELSATGVTFRLKSAMMAESLLPDIYAAASDQNANFHTKLAAVNFLAKAGGIDSPRKDEEQAGAQFNISINLGGGNVVQIGGKVGKPPEIDISDAEVLAEVTEIEDELSYDSTHHFIDEYVPHPLPD